MGEVRRRRDVLVLAAAEQRRERAEEPRRVAERPVLVELELEQVLAQEDHDLRPGQDADVRRQPELERELADEPVAERVERADRRVRVAVRDELVDPDLHLLGGLVRERQGEDLRGPRPARRDQPGDPPGDDLGLAGPGAGDDEQRPVAVGHGPQLLRVQPAEQRVEPGRRVAVDRPRERSGHEAVPDRDLLERRRLAARARAAHGRAECRWRSGAMPQHRRATRDTLPVRPTGPRACRPPAGRPARRRRRERDPERLRLLVRQRRLGPPGDDRLRVERASRSARGGC